MTGQGATVGDAGPLYPDEKVAVATRPRGKTLSEFLKQSRGQRGVEALDGSADDGGVTGVETGLEHAVVIGLERLCEDSSKRNTGGDLLHCGLGLTRNQRNRRLWDDRRVFGCRRHIRLRFYRVG